MCVVKTFSIMKSRRDHRNSTKILGNRRKINKKGRREGEKVRNFGCPAEGPAEGGSGGGASGGGVLPLIFVSAAPPSPLRLTFFWGLGGEGFKTQPCLYPVLDLLFPVAGSAQCDPLEWTLLLVLLIIRPCGEGTPWWCRTTSFSADLCGSQFQSQPSSGACRRRATRLRRSASPPWRWMNERGAVRTC